ncbi:MAG: hypothetical protein J6Y10_00830 [Lachnospiraceae bacterium]|nr:hypothetical protein [Lachnospiraceae bacterium]
MKPHEGRKRRLGDRKDGFRVRNVDPMSRLEPFIMAKKMDGWVLFEDEIDITQTEDFIRRMRLGELPNLSLYEVVFAAIVRTMVDVPELNRFVKHSKLYSRNNIKAAMTVMKGMSRDSDRTLIIPQFECEDTLYDVVKRIEAETGAIDTTVKVEDDENKNDFDMLETAFTWMPDFLLRGAINVIKILDRYGLLPKKLLDLSPFHTSFFLTNMGSIGIDAVYHHIYEFGTLSVFGAIGRKRVCYETQADGSVKRMVKIKMQFVVDERAADGFAYAVGFRKIRSYIMKPEPLLSPPEAIVFDKIDKVKKKKKKKEKKDDAE